MIYEPAEDSFLLQKEVLKMAKGKKVIDMGAGSGVQSLAAKKSGAKSVLAVDINKEAVKYCKALGITSLQSNLFSKVKGKFDVIIFNPPYLPQDLREDSESQRVTTGGKKGDEIILKFLSQAKRHLTKNGLILLIVSSLTPQRKISSLLKRLFLEKKVIAAQKVFFEVLKVWVLSHSTKSH